MLSAFYIKAIDLIENKVLKGSLIPVIERVISKNNNPYVLIYWSRHERHKKLIEEEIFNNELSDRKPIAYLSATKSDYIELDGQYTDDYENRINSLFTRIKILINQHIAYGYLTNWENQIHLSTNKILQNIFSPFQETTWEYNASFILNKLGEAYLGKHFETATNEEKIKGSLISLSAVFKDTLEHDIQNQTMETCSPLELNEPAAIKDLNFLNLSLNTTNYAIKINEPGSVFECNDKNKIFNKLLFNVLSFCKIKNKISLRDVDILPNVVKENVVGDVNATLACSVTAKKLHIKGLSY